MTTRVVDCQRPRPALPGPARNRAEDGKSRHRADVRGAALAALFLVPLAGAAEAPAGWLAAGSSALLLLCLAAIAGRRLPWAWLAVVAAVAGYVLPRGQWPAIGPALFVATVLCLLLWLAHPASPRPRDADRPHIDARQRVAQVMMGLSGERQVAQVLAAELPQEFVLINGLTLPRGAGDIDHLVVGPTGVFLLETKTMAGQIVCEPDGTWRRTRVGRAGTPYDAYIGDPAAQVQRNIFAVRKALRTRVPDVLREPLWIEGLVVFAHPKTELHTLHSRVPAVLLNETSQHICQHVPRRRLQPGDIDAIVAALLEEERHERTLLVRQSAQAMVELVLLLPLVLTLVFATLAISRFVQVHTDVVAIAHEAARAGALAQSPIDAPGRMRERAAVVAGGLGLNPRQLVLDWDLTQFADDPGQVKVIAAYPVDLTDLPLVGAVVSPMVTAQHVEWVDPFRSGARAQPGPGR